MNPNRVIHAVTILATIVCLSAAAMMGKPINQQRKDYRLTYNSERSAAIPKHIMWGQVALGSFRGIFVDFLWYRAFQMKQAGQHREALQLSKWICQLQPRFDQVWSYRAWDMAYNISVTTHTQEERWNWVNKGIRLLRDEGARYNPDSVVIKKELAWIFFHKIGGMSDDVHWYYRRKLAREWQQVLGSPEGQTAEQVIARMQAVALAPDSVQQLRENERVDKLLDQLEAIGYTASDVSPAKNEKLLRAIGSILMYLFSEDGPYMVSLPPWAEQLDGQVIELMRDEQMKEGFDTLVPFLRKKVLRDTYNMDAQYMWQMMAPRKDDQADDPLAVQGFGFGPMDWRHPAAHSAYWAAQGIESAEKSRNKRDIDQLNTDRLIIHSMQALTRTGRVTYDPVSEYIDMMPDPRFIEPYKWAMEYGTERIKRGEYGPKVQSNYDSGYENFLLQAIRWSYLYGEEMTAWRYFREWRKKFIDQPHNKEKVNMDLDQLIEQQMRETSHMFVNVQQFIESLVRRAFLYGMTKGDRQIFGKFIRLARQEYERYQESRRTTKTADQDRMRLPPWRDLVTAVYLKMMKDPQLHLLTRARLWRRTPDGALMRRTYDQIMPIVRMQVEGRDPPMDADKLLPEPPGMAEYREKLYEQRKQQQLDKEQERQPIRRQ